MKNGAAVSNLSALDSTREVNRRFSQAVKDALAENKTAGNSVVVWQDGKVVLIPAEEIDLSVFDEKPGGIREKRTAP